MLKEKALGFFQVIGDVLTFAESMAFAFIDDIAVDGAAGPQGGDDFLGLAGRDNLVDAALEKDQRVFNFIRVKDR